VNDAIRATLESAGLPLSDADRDFFEALRARVVAANERMNLTRLTGPEEFYEKHVLDSALPLLRVPALQDVPEDGLLVADLGAGAGFPGFVIARLFPGWSVALIERTQKKAEFLEDTIQELGIDNAHVVPFDAKEAAARADVLHHGCHLVFARAVGRIAKVTEAAAPLLARGGLVVHYKGGEVDEDELAEGHAAAKRLRLELYEPVRYELPSGAGRSAVLVYRPASRKRTWPVAAGEGRS